VQSFENVLPKFGVIRCNALRIPAERRDNKTTGVNFMDASMLFSNISETV
jgi:hypothetical protein